MSRVGEKVKKERIASKITQKQLAKKLGVSESFINEVETGRRVINQGLIDRISKVLGVNINDIGMSFEEEVFDEKREGKTYKEPPKEEVKDIWDNAFGSVLKTVPVYAYNLKDVINTRQLPLLGGKIEGYAPDKVFYIQIESEDMTGFRIAKGDIALAHTSHEAQNNAICLIEYGDERVVRQIKILDSNKALLVSNGGSVRTETVNVKEIKVLARLDKLEIIL